MGQNTVHRLAARFPGAARLVRNARYRSRLRRGEASGEIRYRIVAGDEARTQITICSTLPPDEIETWRARQTAGQATAIAGRTPENGWFLAPENGLPDVPSAWLETLAMIAAVEDLDAVALADRVPGAPGGIPASIDELTTGPWRPLTLFSAKAFRRDPSTGRVIPRREGLVAKVVAKGGVGADPPRTEPGFPNRRGPYLSDRPLPAVLEIGLRPTLGRLPGKGPDDPRPGLLVTAPFLARGGAEHTLFETLAILGERCRLVFATLAPHRPELDDRRDDFERLSPLLLCLGDTVHPDAMVPLLLDLIDRHRIDVLYNANGTTLFYDFAPRLKAARPGLRIVDHLYDHRVGYIDRYDDPSLPDCVDACIAENRPIRRVLNTERGWPGDRVPVVWSCGRAPEDLPPEEERPKIRERIRAELGLPDDAVVFLTAARMHAQKRPLDLVRLAKRLRDRPEVWFLVVGGGPMEDDVDRAIAEAEVTNIRRLPFRTDVPELILASDAGLLVSDFEGLPVFLLECLQLGRPFVGTDVGDLGAVIRETGAGMVVNEPGDIEGLASAVVRMLDEGLRTRLAAAAAAAGPRFGPERCAERYERVLFPSITEPGR